MTRKLSRQQKHTLIYALILLALLFGAKWVWDHWNTLESPRIDPREVFSPEVGVWADKLAENENCPPEGKIDTNGKLSYSKYCFQAETWKHYAILTGYYPNTEPAELMNFIGDPYEQDRILAWMILNDYKSLTGHWKTSIIKKKVGLPPKPAKI